MCGGWAQSQRSPGAAAGSEVDRASQCSSPAASLPARCAGGRSPSCLSPPLTLSPGVSECALRRVGSPRGQARIRAFCPRAMGILGSRAACIATPALGAEVPRAPTPMPWGEAKVPRACQLGCHRSGWLGTRGQRLATSPSLHGSDWLGTRGQRLASPCLHRHFSPT